jgi:hypothetical protein
MRRAAVFLGLIGLAQCASVGTSGPVTGRVLALKEDVVGAGTKSYANTFKAGQRASVTVSGSGATYLGLYVYDPFGNCIAHDKGTQPNTCDDVAVEWYPPEVQRYAIEVKNFGQIPNSYAISIR